jgi:hypothetical protein
MSTRPKIGWWTCGEPYYQCDYPFERIRASGSGGPTARGDLGKAHRIHAVVNNHQEEHHLTFLNTSSILDEQTLSILIDLGATYIFISGAMLKIIKVKEVKK